MYIGVVGFPTYGFLLLSDSNIWLNSAHLRDIKFKNLSDHDIDISMSLKVKCDGSIEPSVYDFLLEFIGNTWPNSFTLRNKRRRS